MSKIKLSIVIPVYNAEYYLVKCLDSIVNQTLDNIEIIVINDGSSDNSIEIINKYSVNYNNVIVINQINKGVTAARLKGLQLAKGEYIAWVDNDDFLDLSMYEKMYNKAINENLDLVICNYELFPKQVTYKKIWYNSFKNIVDWKFIHKNSVIWNKIFKKEYLLKINYTELLIVMGESSFVLTLLFTNQIGTIDEKLYNYRVGHGGLSDLKNIDWYKDSLDTALLRSEYVSKSNYLNIWKTYFDHMVYMSLVSILIVSVRSNNKTVYAKFRKIIKKDIYFENSYNKLILKNILPLNYLVAKTLIKIISRMGRL